MNNEQSKTYFSQMKQIVSVLLSCFLSLTAAAQTNFLPPLGIPLQLSGNFGELRPGHFHAGLDIRTQGKVGLPIYAIEEGHVSRIAVSEGGYGKVLYIDHSNGYTSVYAHLRQFNPRIEKLVKKMQYDLTAFELDTSFEDNSIKVSRGEVIALSGNTGGSGGPHLHFEIRNTASEKAINPLHFSFNIKDQIKPRVFHIALYPLNEKSHVRYKNTHQVIKTVGNGTHYTAAGNQPIPVYGKIGFGIHTKDKITGSPFNFGVYSIELYKNNRLVYQHILDSLDFANTRCINAHMDFYEATKHKRKIQRSNILEGNKLNTYSNLVNNGAFFFLSADTSTMKFVVKDFMGNSSTVKFEVFGSERNVAASEKKFTQLLSFNQPNRYADSIINIDFPSSCLYEDTPLKIEYEPAIGRCKTPIAHVNTLYDPLNDYMDLSFNLSHLTESERKKATVISLTAKKQVLAAEGGTLKDNWITCKTRSFGPYSVFVDTDAPYIRQSNFSEGGTYSQPKRIYFRCKDNISGIGNYYAIIDNQWILVEYEKNRNQVFFDLHDVTKNGSKHSLKLFVEDKVGNESILKGSFIY